jgi:hypothetical protein
VPSDRLVSDRGRQLKRWCSCLLRHRAVAVEGSKVRRDLIADLVVSCLVAADTRSNAFCNDLREVASQLDPAEQAMVIHAIAMAQGLAPWRDWSTSDLPDPKKLQQDCDLGRALAACISAHNGAKAE